MTAEDIAAGYKQLLGVERGWRDMKSVLDLRPVYHRLEERIRAHVILCWLTLLLIRVAENQAGQTWPAMRRELQRIAIGTFTGHHHRIRHSNFIERTFGETRRRTKVIGRLPGQTSCLTVVWAVLDRASRGWRGLTMTGDGLRLLQDLRRSLLDPPRQLRPRTVTASQDIGTTQNVSAIA